MSMKTICDKVQAFHEKPFPEGSGSFLPKEVKKRGIAWTSKVPNQ